MNGVERAAVGTVRRRSATAAPGRAPARRSGRRPAAPRRAREKTPYGRLSTSNTSRRRPRPRCVIAGPSSSPSATRSSSGSTTLHEPNDVNHRRARASASSPCSRHRSSTTSATRSSRVATTSSAAAPSNASRVASSTLRNPWCSNPSPPVCRSALCSPAVHLNGVSRSRAASIHAARVVRGREQVGLQPAGAELQPQLGLGHGVGGAEPARTRLLLRAARRTRASRRRGRRRRGPRRPPPPRGARCRPGRRGRAARSRRRRRRHPARPARCSAPPIAPAPPVTTIDTRDRLVDLRAASRR